MSVFQGGEKEGMKSCGRMPGRPRTVGPAKGAPGRSKGALTPGVHCTTSEAEERAFLAGLLLGLCAGILVLALSLWLWAVPAVDGALEAVRSVRAA